MADYSKSANILQAKYNTFAVFWAFQEQDPLLKEQEMTSY